MKQSILLPFVFYFFLVYDSVSQSDTLFMKFNEAVPLWEHLVIDPGSQGRNITLPEKVLLDNGILYLLSGGSHPINEDAYGYILQAVDMGTGEQLWSSENTFFTNDTMQLYVKHMYLREDGDIELLGAIRLDSLIPNPGLLDSWIYQSPSAMFRRTINKNDGGLLFTKEGKDTVETYGLRIAQYMHQQDSTYLAFAEMYVMDSSQLLKFGLVVNQLNSEHLYTGSPIDTIFFETEDTLTYFSMEVFQDYMQIDPFTFAVPFYQNRLYYNYKAQLVFFDIQNLSNIKVLKKVDITDVVPRSPNSNLVHYRNTAQNNQLVLTHDYRHLTTGDDRCFLTWLDAQGEVIAFFEEARKEDYCYKQIFLIHVDENRVLAAGYPSYKNIARGGFDILMGLPGEDTLRYVNSITTNAPYEEFPTIRVLELFEGDKLIVGGTVRRNEGQSQIRRQAYYCFDARALGIDSVTSVANTTTEPKIQIYPNPFGKELFIKNLSPMEVERIEIYDQAGKRMISSDWFGDSTSAINTSGLPAGVYSVLLLNSSGQKHYISQAIKIGLD